MQYKFSDLVNEDGSPTEAFWKLWRSDKEGCKANNVFLGKEGGVWVVKPGSPRFIARHNASKVASGRCYTKQGAEELLARRMEMFARAGRTEAELTVIKAALNIAVEYERPKFGTPQERATRRKQWAEYAEARREEKATADYRPSRWELNYVPTEEQDSHQ